uniref:Protein POLLEN DEFECTIVE IN GUIDANCE 1 n=2 Tax=Gossypium TaxID=3633 RepID=A0A0D2V8J2_GOSRA|nr:hypothetical protein B456_013G030000 [Gossypium raimondii]
MVRRSRYPRHSLSPWLMGTWRISWTQLSLWIGSGLCLRILIIFMQCTNHRQSTFWMKCIVEIHCGGPQHLVVRKNESECMILSSACHGDVKWQFKRLSAAELCDFGCFLVLACGVILLGQTDISLIYHMIRGQGTIKLYMIYNVLEIIDKLCQSFGGDVFETLFNSAEGLATCSQENMKFWIRRFVSDQALAMAFSILHSFILLAQAIALSTCIVAHNNALFALLVSNNFAEIKSNVFKRFSKDNIHNLAYADSVERFHISAFLLFVLAQNILEAQGPWFESFLFNAFVVFFCEMLIDIIKHSFLAKFNGIKPIEYSEFLEGLCKQTLNMQTEDSKKNLTFVPLAPACVVIRVLTPVYAAHLPYSPLPWRLFWIIFLISVTYVMLTSLKVMIGMGLQKHATWYVNRCRKRKHHLHFD